METLEALQYLNNNTIAEVFIVGGFVRDYLRGESNSDLDIVVRNLSINKIKSFLGEYGSLKEVQLSKTNDSFDVNILLFKAFNSDIEAQISLPKSDISLDYNHVGTIAKDSRSRDFRINSLYLPINFTSKKDVIDFSGGVKDIKLKRVIFNGDPDKKIVESPIRMLRAISLAARTDYNVSEDSIEAIARNSKLIERCPIEVIRIEFDKILLSNNPSRCIILLHRCRLLDYIIPELSNCINVYQDRKHHKYDVFNHIIRTVNNCDKNIESRLAGLLHDVGKPISKRVYTEDGKTRISFHNHEAESEKLAYQFLTRMKYKTDTVNNVLFLVKSHMYFYTPDWTDSAVRRFMQKTDMIEKYLIDGKISELPLFRLRMADRLGNGFKATAISNNQIEFEQRIIKLYSENKVLNIKDLTVNGNDIMDELGIPPGTIVGNILRFLLNSVIDNTELNERSKLLEMAKKYLSYHK